MFISGAKDATKAAWMFIQGLLPVYLSFDLTEEQMIVLTRVADGTSDLDAVSYTWYGLNVETWYPWRERTCSVRGCAQRAPMWLHPLPCMR